MKAALLATIRERNKTFFSMVVAQAQRVDLDGDQVIFTFAPAHRALRGQLDLRRPWIEELARSAAGRPLAVVSRELEAAPRAPENDDDASAARKADLAARARAEPAVQAVLDVFGGEIEDVEEIE